MKLTNELTQLHELFEIQKSLPFFLAWRRGMYW